MVEGVQQGPVLVGTFFMVADPSPNPSPNPNPNPTLTWRGHLQVDCKT